MKQLKKLMAILLAFVLCVTSGGLYVDSYASDASVSGEVSSTVGGAYISYEMTNTEQGDAEGTIYFHFEDLAQDSVTSIKYYWVDENGEELAGYYHITEFSDDYKAGTSSTNTVANAANGFSFHPGSIIPYGAHGIKAVVTITGSDGIETSMDITTCKYSTTVGGVTATDSTLPQYKKPVEDFTTATDETYQMFYISDFHNYYGWNGVEGDTYDTVTYEYINATGTKGSPQGKALYGLKQIIEAAGDNDKTLGIITAGDIVDGASGGTGGKNATAAMYETVLATYYQAGLLGKYLNIFPNGNHDLIKAYANTDDNTNQFIGFIQKAYVANIALEANSALPTVTGLTEPTDYYYDFYIGNDHYIVLSSPYESGSYGETQLAWFKEKIEKDNADGTRTFIISHEPMTGTGIYATSEYMTDAPTLKTLIEDNSANHETVWFSGHTHVFYQDNVQNVAVESHENVSYVGLPCILDTGLKSKSFYESQGMQAKIYDDKIVMIGRVLYDGSTYRTDIMPSAMYVIDYAEADTTIPTVTIDESAAVNNVLEIDSSVTASISTNAATAYQWYAGGTAIEGATDATYTITKDTPAGRLSVAVTTESGTYYGIATAKVVENIIHIASASQLAKIGTTDEYPWDGSYVLDCDIDLSNYGDWTPIGYTGAKDSNPYKTASNVFDGVFDGNGHTIYGMNAVNVDQSYNYVGLFGIVFGNAEIKNIRFKNCTSTSVAGISAFAGIVAGGMYTDPTGSESLDYGVKVTNISIEDCSVIVQGRNLGNQTLAGSVVGYGHYVTMQDVWSDADVVAQYVGTNEGYSKQIAAGGMTGGCYVGGSGGQFKFVNCVFAGTLDAAVFYEGTVNEDISMYERTGAMLGMNTRNIAGGEFAAIAKDCQNCYYASDVTKVNTSNARAYHGTEVLTAATLKNALSSTHMNSSTKWYNDAEDGLKLVIGRKFDATNFADYTVLWDADDLATINNNLAGKYVLAQDVNMAGYGNWTPIGMATCTTASETASSVANSFSGIFDGNFNTITGMTINYSTANYLNLGLFATTYGRAEIRNVAFDNCQITGTASRAIDAGIVVGEVAQSANNFNGGVLIENVLVKDSTMNCTITSNGWDCGIGTIVGVGTYATLKDCYSNGDIVATSSIASNAKCGVAGMIGAAWRGYTQAENCIFDGTIATTELNYSNGIFAYNWAQASYSTQTKYFVDCYYNSDNLIVSTNTNGGEINGTALNTVDFGIRSTDTLGLDSTYWIHTGYKPMLAISGETAWDGTPDVNEDGIVDICDLVRNKVFEEDNTIENVLYRATNMAEATTDDAVVVDDNDIAQMRTYLLENVNIYLDKTTASNFQLLGNTSANANEFYMDYSYTGFSFEAYATGDVDVDFRYISQNAFPYAKMAVIVDGDVENREVIEIAADGTYTIATVEAGYHTFEVVKITERNHDILKADKLSFKGMLKPAPADAELNIQFIGDSITAASALADYTKGNSSEEQAVQDILQGYAYQTATILDADLSVRARSGIKTAVAATALLPNSTVDGETVILEDDNYDIVVIGLGTNDNTDGDADKQATLKADVTTMLKNARTAYPNAKIVWIYGMMIAVDNDTIKEAVDEFNATDGNVYYFDGFTANQEGGAGHPDAEAHTAAAGVLATYIDSLIEVGVANE